jgi:ubiquinone biosynthesis protein COQ9
MNSLHNQKTVLFESLLPFIAQKGWHKDAIDQWASETKNDKALLHLHFPESVSGLIDFMIEKLNHDLINKLEQIDLSQMKTPVKIKTALMNRFEFMHPYKNIFRHEQQYFMNPIHLTQGLKNLYKIVDTIWFAIGDQTTDFNFYTKRLTLSTIYASSFTYWLKDESTDIINTSMFIDRRLEGLKIIPNIKKRVKNLFNTFSFR